MWMHCCLSSLRRVKMYHLHEWTSMGFFNQSLQGLPYWNSLLPQWRMSLLPLKYSLGSPDKAMCFMPWEFGLGGLNWKMHMPFINPIFQWTKMRFMRSLSSMEFFGQILLILSRHNTTFCEWKMLHMPRKHSFWCLCSTMCKLPWKFDL